MKAGIFLLLLGAASASSLSPVTRVVELLKGLAATIEKEGKAEEDLFESYVCWGKSVIAQKTASNSEAASRIDTLETYIADLDSGRIELTSERSDVEKDIAELSADLEQAKALREKENADFKDAKAEMTQAVTGLKSAMDVLGEATKDHKEGVLLAVHSRLNHGMEALAQQQLNLKHAVKLGERFLNKADANFLRRLLSGEVPRADAKKLNRKATFKMAYKARSFKIQDVLTKMHSTFTANLDEATQNEADAVAAYDLFQTTPNDSALTKEFGGYQIADNTQGVTNLIWSNGGMDPWHGGGFYPNGMLPNVSTPLLTTDNDRGVHYIWIRRGAHHGDLRGPSKNDPIELTDARIQEEAIIWGWIQEAGK